MARFRSAAPAFGALAGILFLVAGCTTPPAPVASPGPSTAVAVPEPESTLPIATPAPQPTPEPVPVREAAPQPEPEAAPVVVPEPIPVVVAKPVAAPVARPASISGSEESSSMFDNFTAYISAIDGRPVTAGRAGWNTALSLPAGQRRLTVTFIRGAFTAQTDLHFQARSEAVYQLKFATDAQIFGKSSYCEFWVVETATGRDVVAPTRVPLTKLEGAK